MDLYLAIKALVEKLGSLSYKSSEVICPFILCRFLSREKHETVKVETTHLGSLRVKESQQSTGGSIS